MTRLGRMFRALVIPASLVLVWELAIRTGWWPRALVAAPSDVVTSAGELMRSGELFFHAWASLARLFLGFGLGASVGVALGALVGLSLACEAYLGPTVQAFSPIPPTAWIPFLIIFFGIGNSSKVALIAIGAFTVVYASTVQGIRSADRKLVEVALVLEKRPKELAFQFLLPAAAPAILTGLRVALGLSWVLLVAAEMIAAKLVSVADRTRGEGLGWLIYDARNFSRADEMIVGMIAMAVLGKVSDMLLARVQSRLLKWREAFSGL